MAVKLNKPAFEHAQSLVEQGKFVFGENRKWYLGIDTEEDEDNKKRYKFPYSDFEKVHRCGVLAAENRAGQYKYYDIERAAAHLHGMIDAAARIKRGHPHQ